MQSGNDSETEFWQSDGLQNKPSNTLPTRRQDNGSVLAGLRGIETSTSRRMTRTPKRMSEKGVGEYSIISSSDVARLEQKQAHTDAAGQSSQSSDSEVDAVDVETLIETESEESQPPSKEPSFAFTHIESRNSSMTSISSSASIDSRTGRKRTLEYVNTWTPISSISTARKSARTSQKAASTSSAQATPQTPRRAYPPAAATAGSPSPYKEKIATPTIVRMSNKIAQALNFTTDAPSASHESDFDDDFADVMDVDQPTPAGVHIVAHSKEVQRLFDELRIEWGVQYEIARGVSLQWWTWGEVLKANLKDLQGTNREAAPHVREVILGGRTNMMKVSDQALWEELDREEAAILEGKDRGLGLQGEWKDKANWYGGQIQQVARLEELKGEGPLFRLELRKMEMRKSHRFGRYLGSRRLLQVSIPSGIVNNRKADLDSFLSQRFILCGRVFVGAGSKDNKAFLVEVAEDYQRFCPVRGDEQRITLEQFVNWHNPLDRNGNQPVTKYITRYDLGYSVSVPVLSFTSKTMHYIHDEYVPPYGIDKKTPAEYIYTDGCGFMNAAALSAIARHMALKERPTAVQGRIAGAKGLWALHPRDKSAVPKIWIRTSQVKINLDMQNLHRAHLIFDLLAPPRVTVPSRLSRLTILNLSHNGVPVNTFIELMKDTLDAEVGPLTEWRGPKAMYLLWKAVERAGGVNIKRIMQHASGVTRAMGLTGRLKETDDLGSEELSDDTLKDVVEEWGDLEDSELPSVSKLRDPITDQPLTVHGVVLDLLQAGFHPLKLRFMYEKLKIITMYAIEDIIRDFHISVPMSAEAFIIPDPSGELKEGEIHFKSTKDLKDPREDSQPNTILGDVLIYRNPNRLPSDVRKVKAVHCHALADYTNVIVLPSVGPCSFASILAGGDYDGDVCVCIYDPRLVEPFKNSEIAQLPDNFKDNFEDQGTIQKVSELSLELAHTPHNPESRRLSLEKALLSGLSTAPVGLYSTFHENAIYAYGYDAPQTLRIAFMFNTILDSRKTGLRVRQDVFKQDRSKYDLEQPLCLKSSKNPDNPQQSYRKQSKRAAHLKTFVLEELMQAGERMRDMHLKRYDGFGKDVTSSEADDDLVRLYKRAEPFLDDAAFREDFQLIQAHIDAHIEMWRDTAKKDQKRKTPAKRFAKAASNSDTGKSRYAQWDELERSFADGPLISADSRLRAIADVELLKASWMYAAKPKLAWTVAFQALCRIKASSRKPVAFTGDFADLMTIPSSAVRVLEQGKLVQESWET